MTRELIFSALSFMGALLVGQTWEFIKKKREELDSDLKAEVKKNTEALTALTLQMQRSEIEFKYLAEKVVSIPEIQKDLALLGAKLRNMENNK